MSFNATMPDPYRGFKFSVNINGFNNSIGFQKITSLKESTDVVEYREGDDPIWKRKLTGLTVYEPVVFSRGLSLDNQIIEWRKQVAGWDGNGNPNDGGDGDGNAPSIVNTGDVTSNIGYERDVTIYMFDKGSKVGQGAGQAATRTWVLHDAWPQSVTVSDLNAEGSEIIIQTMELVHYGLETK